MKIMFNKRILRRFLVKLNPVFKQVVLSCFVLLVFGYLLPGQEELTYQVPPEEIVKLVEAPPTPAVSVSPDGKTIVILESSSLPSIEEVAQPELRLAGTRINPRTNGPVSERFYINITFKDLKKMREYPMTGLPDNPKISDMEWSPDGKQVAFLLTRPGGIELWAADVNDGKAIKLTQPIINGVGTGGRRGGSLPWEWLPDSKRILFKSILKDRGTPPGKDPVPKGPVVQSNEKQKKKAPVRTFQDLLKDKYDEELFIFYATSQLMMVDAAAKQVTPIGKPGIIMDFSTSPDGNYILVERIKQPFSYLVPYRDFPQSIEVWEINGNLVKTIADIPLAESTPRGFDAVRKGPRAFDWRADAPAVLSWVEAQDEGNPRKETDTRDKLFFLAAPFTGNAVPGPVLKYRFRRVQWGTGKLAVVSDSWWSTRETVTYFFQPDFPEQPPEIIFAYSREDRYNDPGRFLTKSDQPGSGRSFFGDLGGNELLMDKSGQYLYLKGRGASPQGDRPFIDKFDLKTKKTTRLWRSTAPYYESVEAVIDINKHQVLTRREGKKIQPNYYIRDLKTGKLKQVTLFPHPFPDLKDVEKQLIQYKREDGVDLTGNLYLPPGYKTTAGPLPVLIWAYPQEFKSRSAAGQVSDSPYRFITLDWRSTAIWVTQGYAVLDGASMPIIGEGDKEPNDTYVEQLVANAKAAIDHLAGMGVGDPKRVSVGGHSYGAFMVANLLAHSRLFAAGIARSGAYNRSLTPFGFQQEERTLWEATDIYIQMSPFMYAHNVKDPILLIHGQADNNSGTFPIQSERFYHALKGHGAVARLVLLPNESHGYRARESILHVMWETYNWLEKYVKNRK
jgi:dipeptidyl aminopeptidase/acylaminoacyl peptidase